MIVYLAQLSGSCTAYGFVRMKCQIFGSSIGGISGNFIATASGRKNGLTRPITINMNSRKS